MAPELKRPKNADYTLFFLVIKLNLLNKRHYTKI
jgi:hypothetical protein